MKSFDELRQMSEDELDAYRKEEEEKLIAATNKANVLTMRHLQAKCERIRKTYNDPAVRAQLMIRMARIKIGEMKAPLDELVVEVKNILDKVPALREVKRDDSDPGS